MRQRLVSAIDDIALELTNISASEGMVKSYHLVKKATQRPHIAFERVWSFKPDLRAQVERSAFLGVCHAGLGDCAYVHVAKLDLVTLAQEKVGCLDISVEDIGAVKSSKTIHHLPRISTYFLLIEWLLIAASQSQEVLKVLVLGPLHDQVQVLTLKEGLLISDDVRVLKMRQETDLVKATTLLLCSESFQLHSFESIHFLGPPPAYFEHLRERSFPCLTQHFKVVHNCLPFKYNRVSQRLFTNATSLSGLSGRVLWLRSTRLSHSHLLHFKHLAGPQSPQHWGLSESSYILQNLAPLVLYLTVGEVLGMAYVHSASGQPLLDTLVLFPRG